MTCHSNQLGFDALLVEAEEDNRQRVFEAETAHLPASMDAAMAYYRIQIEKHHAAMLAMDFEEASIIRDDAHLLARKLNHGEPGIIADDDAPGCVLARETAAKPETVPLWGQEGTFILHAADMALSVSMQGLFGIGATAMAYLGFEVRAADTGKPFLSSTGYRSFLGCSIPPEPDLTVDGFVTRIVETYVAKELKGRLVRIDPKYAERSD